MIDNERTLEIFGYVSTDLTSGSGKKVVARCDECGAIRVLRFHDYRDLCRICVKSTKSFIEKQRKAQTGKKQSEYTKKKKADAIRGENHYLWKGGAVTLICTWCNCSYTVRPDKKHTSRFCSIHCKAEYQAKYNIGELAGNWQGGGVAIVCAQCGKEFKISQYAEKTAKFCSKKCSYEYKMEHDKGENNPNWRGGISNGRYCYRFNFRFKEKIRIRYDRTCYLCTKQEKHNGRRLDIHHVSYEKNALCNDVKHDFVPLCARCHGKTSYNRFFWQTLITYSLAYEEDYYAIPIPNLLVCLPL